MTSSNELDSFWSVALAIFEFNKGSTCRFGKENQTIPTLIKVFTKSSTGRCDWEHEKSAAAVSVVLG